MKIPLKPRAGTRPLPEEVLKVAAEAAPRQPPAVLEQPDKATTLNLRVRASTIRALARAAKERGLTQKQVIAEALQAAGIAVAHADLEDRTPRRRL
jgi:hypothetical protein